MTSGFDGTVSWTITSKGASIDQGTPLESVRRDADLQYALHQPDYDPLPDSLFALPAAVTALMK